MFQPFFPRDSGHMLARTLAFAQLLYTLYRGPDFRDPSSVLSGRNSLYRAWGCGLKRVPMGSLVGCDEHSALGP